MFTKGQKFDFENYIYEMIAEQEPRSEDEIYEIAEEIDLCVRSAVKEYINDIDDPDLRECLSCYFYER